MYKQINWQGVFPAVTTKFTPEGELDLETFRRGITAQINAGVDGIIVGGSLGENSTLTPDEKVELMKCARTSSPPLTPVLINVAEGSTRNAIALANRAEAEGADGMMLLPPMMYKASEAEVVRFYLDVAGNSGLPILVYNNPVDYKIEITIQMFDQLIVSDRIQAVKESTRDVSNVTQLLSHFGDRLKVLTGVDTIATESLMMGAHGWVAGLVNAFPEETVAIFKLIQAKRYDDAVKIHRWFLPLLELDIHPQLVQNIKLAEWMTGLGTEEVRLPRMKLQGKERVKVIEIVQKGIDTRPALNSIMASI